MNAQENCYAIASSPAVRTAFGYSFILISFYPSLPTYLQYHSADSRRGCALCRHTGCYRGRAAVVHADDGSEGRARLLRQQGRRVGGGFADGSADRLCNAVSKHERQGDMDHTEKLMQLMPPWQWNILKFSSSI